MKYNRRQKWNRGFMSKSASGCWYWSYGWCRSGSGYGSKNWSTSGSKCWSWYKGVGVIYETQ